MTAIVSLAAIRVEIPLVRPFHTAAGTWLVRDAWLIRAADANGRLGVGEASLAPDATGSERELLARGIRALVASPDRAARALVEDVPAADAPRRALQCALGTALLDLEGTGIGSAGGRAEWVPVNATIAEDETDASVAAVRRAITAGYTTLKLKGGGERSTSTLVARLAEVRAAVGPEVAIRLDVNGAWTAEIARERLESLRDLDLEYVEQPIPPGPPDELARLREASPVPLAADEGVGSVPEARALLAARAVDVLVVKPARLGGPAAALAVAAAAREHGAGVVISTLLETGVGIAMALLVASRIARPPGRAHGLATADLLADDLVVESLLPERGRLWAPRGPGLGVHLDDAALERAAVERIGAWP